MCDHGELYTVNLQISEGDLTGNDDAAVTTDYRKLC